MGNDALLQQYQLKKAISQGSRNRTMPFFVKTEAGSAISDLLDERLRRLQQQLAESDKSSEGLAAQVASFHKRTREMCHAAGAAVGILGEAIQMDFNRAAETGQATTGALGAPGSGQGGPASGGPARRKSESPGSRESMRTELLALQLVECASEMEEQIKIQVLEPMERMRASRDHVQSAIRERLRAADGLAVAHSEYARAVARCNSPGESVSGGPPPEVVRAGERVVAASDVFADAHGLAEAALSRLLDERGAVLREAISSLKAAQAGFFIRASRCVSSSVGLEPADTAERCSLDGGHQATPLAPQRSRESPCSAGEETASSTSRQGSDFQDTEPSTAEKSPGSGVFNPGVESRVKAVKTKWRKAGDREVGTVFGLGFGEEMSHAEPPKRRRSSNGWLTRLTSSFQSNRFGLADGEEPQQQGTLSPGLQAAGSGTTDYPDSSNGPSTSSTAPPSTSRSLFSAEEHPTEAEAVAETEESRRGLEAGETSSATGDTGNTGAVGDEAAARLTRTSGEGRALAVGEASALDGGEDEGGESDYETESNTTEGFGSDDAGHLWDGGRDTGPLDRTPERSPLPERVQANGPDRVESEANGAVEIAQERAPGSTSSDGERGSGKQGEDGGPALVVRTGSQIISPSPAPASVLPAATPQASPESPLPHVEKSRPSTPPRTPKGAKTADSPGVSDTSSTRESPRAWRLSWWARASDRHRPPPPALTSPEDEDAAAAAAAEEGSLVASLIGATTGGQEAKTDPLSGGLAFAPAFNAGDGPVAVDGGGIVKKNAETAPGEAVTTVSAASPDAPKASAGTHPAEADDEAKVAAALKAAVSAERQRRSRALRRIRADRSWLSADSLSDRQGRPLEAASEYLDVVGLGRASRVCRGWKERLRGKGAERQWVRCVRLADGVPDKWRARFYLHVLYDNPAWISREADRQLPTDRPRRGVYEDCLATADAGEAKARAAAQARHRQALNGGNRRRPRGSGGGEGRAGQDDTQENARAMGEEHVHGLSVPTPLAYKWLEEIETDVLRTCPSDATQDFDAMINQRRHGSGPSAAGGRAEGGGDLTSALASFFGDSNSDGISAGDGGRRKPRPEPRGWEAVRIGFRREAPPAQDTPTAGAGGSEEAVPASAGGRRRSPGGGGTRDRLRRVLRAFGVYNPRVSYCQGMNFVALSLLEACSGDDENAFWILSGMCNRLELEGLWCQGLERLDLCFYSLDRLLRRHCPSLAQHLLDEGVELSMFTSRWFVTLFTCSDVFGRTTSRKILDMFMVEGWPLLFKLSLGVLLEMRPLLEPTDMEGILRITKFPRAHLFGLRRDGTGRRVAGASFEEATRGSLCESIRAGQMVEHALLLHVSEETLRQHLLEYRTQNIAEPGSD